MLPLNSIIKDAFDKFDQDFQAANLLEGKYIRAPPSTAKVVQGGTTLLRGNDHVTTTFRGDETSGTQECILLAAFPVQVSISQGR